jgi:hypothetical protein
VHRDLSRQCWTLPDRLDIDLGDAPVVSGSGNGADEHDPASVLHRERGNLRPCGTLLEAQIAVTADPGHEH